MSADPVDAMETIERLCARVWRAPVADHVVALACELLDWGHNGDAVREVVGRESAKVAAEEWAELGRRVLEEAGYEPGFDVAPERLETLRHALRVVARDLPTAGVAGEPRLVLPAGWAPPTAGVELADGSLLLGNAGLQARVGRTPVEAVAAVAEVVQEDLMERRSQVWPLCADHRFGLHPRTAQDAAVWWCTGGGGHVAARIGTLAARRRPGRRLGDG